MAESIDASAGANESTFADLALQLFALQFEGVPIYRQWCESRGRVPARVSRWCDIPVLPTRVFQDFEVSSLPAHARTRLFLSSGTVSQARSRHHHGEESLRLYESSLLPWFTRHVMPARASSGLEPFPSPNRLLVLTPRGAEAPNSSLVHMFETVARSISFARIEFVGRIGSDGGWELEMDRTIAFLDACAEAGQPVVVLGTAFSFVHLLDELAARGRRFALPAGSRCMETGGYKGRSRSLPRRELHALIGAGLGIQQRAIVCEYGMSELSSQAYDRVVEGSAFASGASGSDPVFHFPPWARVRVVSPESGEGVAEGEPGLVQVFDLANVYSVGAVQTEDLALRRGLGFELVGRAAEAPPRGCSLMMDESERR